MQGAAWKTRARLRAKRPTSRKGARGRAVCYSLENTRRSPTGAHLGDAGLDDGLVVDVTARDAREVGELLSPQLEGVGASQRVLQHPAPNRAQARARARERERERKHHPEDCGFGRKLCAAGRAAARRACWPSPRPRRLAAGSLSLPPDAPPPVRARARVNKNPATFFRHVITARRRGAPLASMNAHKLGALASQCGPGTSSTPSSIAASLNSAVYRNLLRSRFPTSNATRSGCRLSHSHALTQHTQKAARSSRAVATE